MHRPNRIHRSILLHPTAIRFTRTEEGESKRALHVGRDCLANPKTALYSPHDEIGNRHSAAMPTTQGYKKLSAGHNQDKAAGILKTVRKLSSMLSIKLHSAGPILIIYTMLRRNSK